MHALVDDFARVNRQDADGTFQRAYRERERAWRIRARRRVSQKFMTKGSVRLPSLCTAFTFRFSAYTCDLVRFSTICDRLYQYFPTSAATYSRPWPWEFLSFEWVVVLFTHPHRHHQRGWHHPLSYRGPRTLLEKQYYMKISTAQTLRSDCTHPDMASWVNRSQKPKTGLARTSRTA